MDIENWAPTRPIVPRKTSGKHFGETVRSPKYGLHLTRNRYLPQTAAPSLPQPSRELFGEKLWASTSGKFTDDTRREYTEEHLDRLRKNALKNFDLNMSFFERIDRGAFEAVLDRALAEHPKLVAVDDLHDWDGVSGVYVMVLDDYAQVYVGQSRNIRQRIRHHWSKTMPLDRLVWGDVETSVLSIDSFRAFDTTRLLALPMTSRDDAETRLARAFPPDYLLNRVATAIHIEQLDDAVKLVESAKIRDLTGRLTT